MIRALLALGLLCALPAQSQDFRGLLPGMPASDLARLGEPFHLQSEGELTIAGYPLPYERTMVVLRADGIILSLSLQAPALSTLQPPASDGLRLGETTFAQARAMAGSDGFAFDVISTLPQLPASGWEISYTLSDHPDLVLTLTFHGRLGAEITAAHIASPADMPPDAILVSAGLIAPATLARYPLLSEMVQMPPTDAVPFALPLAEAFPSILLPQ